MIKHIAKTIVLTALVSFGANAAQVQNNEFKFKRVDEIHGFCSFISMASSNDSLERTLMDGICIDTIIEKGTAKDNTIAFSKETLLDICDTMHSEIVNELKSVRNLKEAESVKLLVKHHCKINATTKIPFH